MKISKTTINMAARRGVAITVTRKDEFNDGKTSVYFSRLVDYGFGPEPIDECTARYTLAADGLFFGGGCYDTEGWPHWIEDESHLRELLPALAAII